MHVGNKLLYAFDNKSYSSQLRGLRVCSLLFVFVGFYTNQDKIMFNTFQAVEKSKSQNQVAIWRLKGYKSTRKIHGDRNEKRRKSTWSFKEIPLTGPR